METFVCPNCGNSNLKYVGHKNNKPYCRLCLTMNPTRILEPNSNISFKKMNLGYSLTKYQHFVSKQVVNNYELGINTLIYAVTGAGKTELIYGVIQYALSKGKQVGFAVPRREVAKELYVRIKDVFSYNTVCLVHGGNTGVLQAEIIVLTTHQLYRYPNYFDLLIIDEIDAFPFKNNDVLNSMFFKSIKGNYVMMSATPSDDIIKFFSQPGFDIAYLTRRYHNKIIPVPIIKINISILKYLVLLFEVKRLLRNKKQIFIFAPTIIKCEQVYKFLSLFFNNGAFIHSKVSNQTKLLDLFRNKIIMFLVSTAVLERGITVRGLQVIIFESDHPIYDEYSLVQISGRAGRKGDEPYGEVIFIANKETREMVKARETIIGFNKTL